MASKDNYCTICDLQHKTNDAEVWCPQCEEYLCSVCKTHHGLAKSSKNHKTLTLSDVKNLPAYIHEIKSVCDVHDEKLEYFCSKHDMPFCILCTESHKDCGKFTVIRDIQGAKSSATMTILEENLDDIQQALQNLSDDRKLNLHNLADQKKQCHQKVKEIRLKINKHLDSLDAAITKEIDDTYTKNKSDLDDFLNTVEVSKERIEQIKKDVDRIKKHATEIQFFLSSRKIEQDLLKEKENVKRMYGEKNHLEEFELFILPEKGCKTGNVLKSFGQVNLERNAGSISWKSKTSIQGQIFMPTSSVDISDLKVTKRLHVDLKKIFGDIRITSCSSTPDGRILLCDNKNKQIIILNDKGHYTSDIKLLSKPNKAIYIEGDAFVVSREAKTLTKIVLETSLEKKKVIFEEACDAITSSEDNIIVQVEGCEYRIFDKKLKKVGAIPLCFGPAPFLASKGDNLYICKWGEHVVNCYNMTGKQQWKFQNPKLTRPYGITTDDHGNIYVCGNESNNIVIISPDGDKYRILLDEKELVKRPDAIYFNEKTKRLLVTSYTSLMEFDVTERKHKNSTSYLRIYVWFCIATDCINVLAFLSPL